MRDYAVWTEFKGKKMIIDYVKSDTLRKATNLAKKIYGPDVTVTDV
jgi:hypothetical protein